MYDFYIEVVPILERLVGYTIELAMTEIETEEETILRKNACKRFDETVYPELVEVNRRRIETYLRNEEIRGRINEIEEKESSKKKHDEHKMKIKIIKNEVWSIMNRSVQKMETENSAKADDLMKSKNVLIL